MKLYECHIEVNTSGKISGHLTTVRAFSHEDAISKLSSVYSITKVYRTCVISK